MEKGTVAFLDKNGGAGMIRKLADGEVRFHVGDIIGRDRNTLTAGDFVWFEMENINNVHMAINVRKCY